MRVNGQQFTRRVEPRRLLVDFIRDDLNLTGTHIGCDSGHCGACTVLLNGAIVKSCLLLAVQANNAEIQTIEGVSSDSRSRMIQDAFLEKNALQCGYCTPGMVLSSLYLLRRNPKPSDADIRKGIDGNLCRCTGYLNIIKAVQAASERLAQRT